MSFSDSSKIDVCILFLHSTCIDQRTFKLFQIISLTCHISMWLLYNTACFKLIECIEKHQHIHLMIAGLEPLVTTYPPGWNIYDN